MDRIDRSTSILSLQYLQQIKTELFATSHLYFPDTPEVIPTAPLQNAPEATLQLRCILLLIFRRLIQTTPSCYSRQENTQLSSASLELLASIFQLSFAIFSSFSVRLIREIYPKASKQANINSSFPTASSSSFHT